MVIQWLVYIGLAITPFILLQGYDSRYPKEVFTITIATSIALYAIYNGLLKPFKNKALMILLLFGVLTLTMVPHSGLVVGAPRDGTLVVIDKLDLDNLWNYKPVLYWFIYTLMVAAISSIEIEDFSDFFGIIAWTGTLVSAMVIAERFGFHEWIVQKPVEITGKILHPEIFSFIGQSTLCAAFICLCILAAFYLRNYWMASLMSVAVLITQSRLSYYAMAMILTLFLFCNSNKKRYLVSTLALFLIFIGGIFWVAHYSDLISISGRLGVWQQAIYDVVHHNALTGYGPGAFHYAFMLMHDIGFVQAHNEFIEFFYNNGLIGLIIFVSAIFLLFKDTFKVLDDRQTRYLLSMFIVSIFLACGTFVWQLAVCSFYTAVIVGLIYNKIRSNYVMAC